MDLPKGLLAFSTEDESHAPPFAISYYLGEPYPMWEGSLTVGVGSSVHHGGHPLVFFLASNGLCLSCMWGILKPC